MSIYFFLAFYCGTITSLSSFYAKITIILCEKSNSNNVQTLVLEVTGSNLYYGQPASNSIVQLSRVSGGDGAYTFGTPTYRPYVITIPTTLASSSGYEYVITHRHQILLLLLMQHSPVLLIIDALQHPF